PRGELERILACCEVLLRQLAGVVRRFSRWYMLKLEDRGLVFDATLRPVNERIAFFTSLLVLRSGSVLCGFQNGPSKQSPTPTVRVCRSEDGGRAWYELTASFETAFGGVPGSLATAEFVEVKPGRLLLFSSWFDRSDPKRPLFDPTTEGLLRSKLLAA